MGAKQSKRSVDISGKEAESAGEVAASIAGGEGRVEQLADADALKPQLNGDAHIHEANTEEKQKDVDSGTPENEKDATTEKEEKQENGEAEAAPLTNGESEQKVENGGDATPTAEDVKKPKKEKVKKKWSLRSISFSRKDKPKQDKKNKDEEAKTNGEPEKVPEETIEAASEVPVVTESAEEVKATSETKEDKTPETPVTEPITNGSSTPESPKIETPVVEEPAVSTPSPETERPEEKPETKPEQLPVNGLSLEESPKEICEHEKKEDSKEETIADTTEVVPEISIKKEVCVEQMPLIDSTPPPLPANPPPSSVASFAATTMAPELTDASLVNTADNAVLPLSDPNANVELNQISFEPKDLTLSNEISQPAKDVKEETLNKISGNAVEPENKESVNAELNVENNHPALVDNVEIDCQSNVNPTIETVLLSENVVPSLLTPPSEVVKNIPEVESEPSERTESVTSAIEPPIIDKEPIKEIVAEEIDEPSLTAEVAEDTAIKTNGQIISENGTAVSEGIEKEIVLENTELELPPPSELIENLSNGEGLQNENSHDSDPELPDPPMEVYEESSVERETFTSVNSDSILHNHIVPETVTDVEDALPPPPPICEELVSNICSSPDKDDIVKTNEIVVNSDISTEVEDSPNGEQNNINEDNEQNIKNKSKDSLGNFIETIECNGIVDEEKTLEEAKSEIVTASNETKATNGTNVEVRTTANSEHNASGEPTESAAPQEVVSVSDKLSELIPEVPEVPEIITETAVDTTNDVAVAN